MATTAEKTFIRWMKRACYLVAAAYAINFFFLAFLVGPHDFNHLSGYYELAYRFWATQGLSLPQFNPFLCGGRTLGGDPQIPIFHPASFLVGIFGPAVVLRWEMLSQIAVGSLGLWKLLTYLKLPKINRLWGLLVFLCGGGVIARFEVGHVTLGFLYFFPLFLWLSYEMNDRKKLARSFSLYLLAFIYCGLYKPNFFAYGVPLLALEAIPRALFQRRPSIILTLVLATGLAAIADAVSLWPAAWYFDHFPRTSAAEAKWTFPWAFLANALLPLRSIPNAWYGSAPIQRHEYNIFVGPVALFFSYFALKSRPWKAETKALVVWIAISFLLGLGCSDWEFHWYSPYSWFSRFWPGFQSLRVPTRLWYGSFLGFVVLSSIGFRFPKQEWQKTLFWSFGILPLVATAVVNLTKTTWIAEQSQGKERREYPAKILFTHLEEEDRGLNEIRLGQGILECVDNIQAYRAALSEGNALGVSTGALVLVKANWESWNRIHVEGKAEKPFRLELNLNHSDLWRWEGPSARLDSGKGQKLAVRSDTPDLGGTLVFEQPGVFAAAMVSGIAAPLLLLGVGLTLWRTRRSRG